jgi:hypothetical protein
MIVRSETWLGREADHQCVVRDTNEARERVEVERDALVGLHELHCECGDPACLSLLLISHDDYEAVREWGSHFLISVNHENPTSAFVIAERQGFAVIDVVLATSRRIVLVGNPRHDWIDGRDA